MPSASQWVRGQDTPVPRTGTAKNASCASEWVRGQGEPASGAYHKSSYRPNARPSWGYGAEYSRGYWPNPHAGSWSPHTHDASAQQGAQPGRKRHRTDGPTPPKTTANCPDEKRKRLDEQIRQKEEESAALRNKAQAKKYQHEIKIAMAIQKERDEQQQAQQQAQAIASAMEGSAKLSEKRKKYNEEHKHEIEAKAQAQASKAKKLQQEEDQLKAIARILKAHTSHYDVLMIPETADSEKIHKAWKKLSLLVHPDRCRFPGAQEAFVKISEAADALHAAAA